jgi:16S rRNA (guanine966-N2)-methyltransferase
MRIIGGARRGLKLADVGAGDTAAHLRPTSDRVREAIFNLLINGGYGNPVQGAQVLDLFAGTGAMGLEALSRGAGRATFVDDGAKALSLLRTNIAKMRVEDATACLRRDASALGPNAHAPFTLVFLDPPYGKSLGECALASAIAGGWLGPGAMIVWEESTAPRPPAAVTQLDQRTYGDTLVTLLRTPE